MHNLKLKAKFFWSFSQIISMLEALFSAKESTAVIDRQEDMAPMSKGTQAAGNVIKPATIAKQMGVVLIQHHVLRTNRAAAAQQRKTQLANSGAAALHFYVFLKFPKKPESH